MTIYELSIISTSGFPYYNLEISPIPENVKIHLRFFDFSKKREILYPDDLNGMSTKFDLTAGLISALYEFAKSIDKKINILEFQPTIKIEKIDEIGNNKTQNYEGDVLITVQTESFLLDKAIFAKIKLIYELVISTKIPLDSAYEVLQNEEDLILDIITDAKAKEHLSNNRNEIKSLGNSFLLEMKNYGLEAICITSFDFSPLIVFSKKYSLEEVKIVLRNIGFIPEISSYNWIYRQSFLLDEQIWVYIVNSGIGPTIEGLLFEPYFYLLIAKPESYMGEFPGKLTSKFNEILG